MKVLCVTSLFPDKTRPTYAPFNLRQILSLARLSELSLISPVPWPHKLKAFARGIRIEPPAECRDLMEVHYPTYFYVPKVLRSSYGRSYYLSIRSIFNAVVRGFRPDVVYATWAYPDCYAAYLAAGERDLPLVVRVHGSDINDYMRFPSRRKRILEAVRGSDAVIVVSRALGDTLVEAGVERERIHLVYNGIDRSVFFPRDRLSSRRELGLKSDAKIVLFAGNLKRVKGIDILIEAFAGLNYPVGLELHILGEGPLKETMLSDVRELGIRERVFFHGAVPHAHVPLWLAASDLLCLPSRSEGTPNIVLEALACARPVAASNVGGVGEIISESDGILFPPEDVAGCRDALREALEREWKEESITCPAPSWGENASKLLTIFEGVVEARRRGHME